MCQDIVRTIHAVEICVFSHTINVVPSVSSGSQHLVNFQNTSVYFRRIQVRKVENLFLFGAHLMGNFKNHGFTLRIRLYRSSRDKYNIIDRLAIENQLTIPSGTYA